ncbi:hypothetical protein GCM10028808_32970 [Spirosoma migulaei]
MGKMVSVLFAFLGTSFTDFSTQDHKITRELRTTGIKSATEGTYVGAVAAEFNAGTHVMTFSVFVAHFQAGGGAALAGFSTLKTRIYVCMRMFHRFHNRCCFIDHRWSDKLTTHTR